MDLAKDENSSSDDYESDESEGDNDDRTLFAANIPYSQVSKHFLLICFYKSCLYFLLICFYKSCLCLLLVAFTQNLARNNFPFATIFLVSICLEFIYFAEIENFLLKIL